MEVSYSMDDAIGLLSNDTLEQKIYWDLAKVSQLCLNLNIKTSAEFRLAYNFSTNFVTKRYFLINLLPILLLVKFEICSF